MASDPQRIGGKQVRGITIQGDEMILRPTLRPYGASVEQRELVWKKVWNPEED